MADDPAPNGELSAALATDPFYQELAALYDNPEVFFDPSVPLLPRFRIVNYLVPNKPTVINTEITDNLLFALREATFSMLRDATGFEEAMLEHYGTSNWDETRAKILDEKDYAEGERELYWFFVRHFPKLVAHVYNIAVRTAVVHTLRRSSQETAEERRKVEKGIKEGLAILLAELRKDIQKMLGTRSRGGSTSKLREDLRKSLHLEYANVLAIAREVKKQCDNLHKTFNASRNRASFEDWKDFWKDNSIRLFPQYDPEFLILFAMPDNPSASDVAYCWVSRQTTLSQSYVRKKVKELRKAAKSGTFKQA